MFFTQKIQNAINVAAHCHRNHKRIGLDLPYIVHPYSVAIIVSEYTTNEDVFCAAILHDVIEDSAEYNSNDILKIFGDKVLLLVKSVSEEKSPSDSIETLRQNWEFRKQKYLDGLKKAPREALIICAADSIHNLESLIQLKKNHGDKFWNSFGASMPKKLALYGKILKQLKLSLSSPIIKRFDKTYNEALSIL